MLLKKITKPFFHSIALYLLFSLLFNGCIDKQSPSPSLPTHSTKNKIFTIDLDKEMEILESTSLRNSSVKTIEQPIYIGDNDEVSFKGDILEENSPLTIEIEDKKTITFSGSRYKIKTMDLTNGDLIKFINNKGEIFAQFEVIKEN